MARIVGLLLMLVAIYCGVKIYVGEVDRASSDIAIQEAAGEEETAPRQRASGRAAPTAITSRVRERVTNAVAEGARRHSGETE